MSNNIKYSEISDYLRAPVAPSEATGLLVFGRKDLLVASKVVDLARQRFANFVVITGGVGKDSGDLAIPEAEFLAQGAEKLAEQDKLTLPPLFTETQARNGGENVRNSLTLMRRGQLPYSQLTAVAHATSLRRLAAMVEHESTIQQDPVDIYRIPTDYVFNPSNPTDQQEARAELLRIADWPDKGWLQPQADLPENLVDFARDQNK